MFRLSLAPANKQQVKRWRFWSGVTAGGTGVLSLGSLTSTVREAFPPEMVDESFIYMAVAVALITALPLVAFPKVLSISLSQLGIATSLILLACSIAGVFRPNYSLEFTVVVALVGFVFFVLFVSSLLFAIRERSWSDLLLWLLLLGVTVFVWVSLILRLAGER